MYWINNILVGLSSETKPQNARISKGTIWIETDTQKMAVYNGATWDWTEENVPSGMIQGMYVGISTDTKPSTNVSNGSLFIETDTKKIYIYVTNTWEDLVIA